MTPTVIAVLTLCLVISACLLCVQIVPVLFKIIFSIKRKKYVQAKDDNVPVIAELTDITKLPESVRAGESMDDLNALLDQLAAQGRAVYAAGGDGRLIIPNISGPVGFSGYTDNTSDVKYDPRRNPAKKTRKKRVVKPKVKKEATYTEVSKIIDIEAEI